MMIGCEKAIRWIQALDVDDVDIQERVVNRMIYQFKKEQGIVAKPHKGKYINDFYTCGNCGHKISEPYWKYCPNCGYAIIR